jgi:uncharacterized protein (TIGR02246 family)
MRSLAAIILALSCFSIPLAGPADQPPTPEPPPQIIALAQAVVDAANANDASKFAGLYTDDAIVIDELAPYVWTGASAGAQWWTAVAKILVANKVASLHAAALSISECRVSGDAAYMITPLRITETTAAGKTRTELGTQTYTFRNVDGTWKISSAVWTTKP